MPRFKRPARRLRRAGLVLFATLLLAACGQGGGTYSPGAGPYPPAGGSAGGGMDPSWRVCNAGNPHGDYNCTLN